MAIVSALFLLAMSNANAGSSPPPTGPVRVEARASVRILRGARLSWDSAAQPLPEARITRATVRLEDGRLAAANLIEFE